MKIIDLTHPWFPEMPLYPGTPAPRFEQEGPADEDGFALTTFTLQSHMGTHMDAPAHYFRMGKTLDQFEMDTFIGRAILIDLTNHVGEVPVEALIPYQARIQESDFVILHTGWSRYYGSPAYLEAFPVLTLEAATWLTQFELKGVAMDTISADAVSSTSFDIHKCLLKHGFVIVENLTQLDEAAEAIQTYDKPYLASFMPLKITQADGAPIRAAILML